jgi:hypothetical protein
MTSEQRFAALGKLVNAQARNASWAAQREAEIKALPSRHDDFKQATFAVVDCRSTMCRVLATFPDESAQGMFDTAFPGFVALFPYALSREVKHGGHPAIEAFLALDDPFPG